MIDSIRKKIAFYYDRGLFHIFGANIVNKIIAFVSNTVIVRMLTKDDFGIFSAANNVYSIFMLFSGAGMLNAALQYGIEERDAKKKHEYIRYCFEAGLIVDIIFGICIFIYGAYDYSAIKAASKYIVYLAFLPILEYVVQYELVLLRINIQNEKYSRLINFNSIIYSFFTCFFAYFSGVEGLIIGRYLAYLISIIYGKRQIGKFNISTKKEAIINKIELWRFSIGSGMVAFLNSILYSIDILLLVNLIGNPQIVADYKVGAIIPESLIFIPNSILIFVIPYFIKNNNNVEWLKKNIKKLYLFSGLLYFAISMLLFVFAPTIIRLLWGADYINSYPILRILSIQFFVIATFRFNGTNILTSLRKVKVNLIISIVTGIANLILDYYFISLYGSVGAAIATLIVVVIASIMSYSYITYYVNSLYHNENQ
jgi:O-antigen/teichoic acid export membrane protein